MADLDPELIGRAHRWCAEAGREASADDLRAALAPLSWNELLAVKALLADPPPARPLGPHALADIARGASPDAAAEREREGRYLSAGPLAPGPSPSGPVPALLAARCSGKTVRGPALRVRRARDRVPQAASAPPPRPLLEELHRPEGRAVLERLVRRLGPRRSAVVAALAAGWRCADGSPVNEGHLCALLDEHGMARAFERRERTLLLHALRATGGSRPRAAAELGISAEAFWRALERLGAAGEAEAVREERRADVRRRATLSERVRLLAADEDRLADLGLLEEVLADLRGRLPEHLKALRAVERGPLAPALGRSLSLSRPAVETLARRFGLDLGPSGERSGDRAPAGRARRPVLRGTPPRRGRSR